MTRIAHLSDLHLLEEDYRSRTGLLRYRLAFLSTGVVENDCPAGVCDYSAMSGCTGGEDQDLCD